MSQFPTFTLVFKDGRKFTGYASVIGAITSAEKLGYGPSIVIDEQGRRFAKVPNNE